MSRIISVISTTFTPVIPAITGAGMIKALLAILKLAGAIDPAGTTYRLLDTVADAAFFFLPVLLAYGAAIKFECNPILAMTLAGALLHLIWLRCWRQAPRLIFSACRCGWRIMPARCCRSFLPCG